MIRTRQRQRREEGNDEDPQEHREAIERALEGGGWNDWSFIEKLTLKTVLCRGRYPWRDGPKRHTFWTANAKGSNLRTMDLARTCGEQEMPGAPIISRFRQLQVSYDATAAIWNYNTNDVWITILFAGLNAMLLFIFEIAGSAWSRERSDGENLWLVALFALDVVFLLISSRQVWFTH